ncbi:hypothetical protein TTHERM_00295680 (macronuclear) [Tetrahymena thermophila SB210]|uniref:Uncharacterized protein n=1 Tax=Tetrahymena thermophila (strain SB210) TaxID=312017 RepID=I7MDY5_TETTS|nr:hypothetical protein TTHERM_00295680 [Tetrahymena thermophila SB210]EAR92955.2 hypothetical protein TTHERM_00295680 [Tetrahymena thermophila SB210]|eukprot:XP_001013200.2 hypothetical protein TTHERM_00295680 [Tetrahymena thermophila SB210]
MRSKFNNKFYDEHSPSKRVRWISPNSQAQESDKISQAASIIASQEISLNQSLQKSNKQLDISKELIQNKEKLINFLVDNNIEFQKLHPNEYAATIKLVNINQQAGNQINVNGKSQSPMKVSQSQGYFTQKEKELANISQINKQNKQPFISAILNDIKSQKQSVDLASTFNISMVTDPSIDQNQRFLQFLEEKQAQIQRELTNADQLLSIHRDNQSIKQLRDKHNSLLITHKNLCAIYLRSPQEFRNKAIQYLKPIQSTIIQGNYSNLKNNSDLEILYALLQKLLLDNCDAQTMEQFVDEQIKMQANSLYSSTNQNLKESNRSESLKDQENKTHGSLVYEKLNSFKKRNKEQKPNKKIIIVQQNFVKSASPSKRVSKSSDANKSRNEELNRSIHSKKDNLNKSFSSKKDEKSLINEAPKIQIHNNKLFSIYGSNNKVKQNKSTQKPNNNQRSSLSFANNSSTASSLKESLLLGKSQLSTNSQMSKKQEGQKDKQSKFSLGNCAQKLGNNLKIQQIYNKAYKSANTLSPNYSDSLTDHFYSQSTTSKQVGNFDFSKAVSQQSNRSLSNNKDRKNQSIQSKFFSNRITTENTPKSQRTSERRNSRSLSPSKPKSYIPSASQDNSTSSRKLIKASDMQKEYEINKSPSPTRKKTANFSQVYSPQILKSQDFQKEYEKILIQNFENLKMQYSKSKIVGKVNEKIIEEEFTKSLKILNQNFHLLSSDELMNYYDFIQNKAQILYRQFMKQNQFW